MLSDNVTTIPSVHYSKLIHTVYYVRLFQANITNLSTTGYSKTHANDYGFYTTNKVYRYINLRWEHLKSHKNNKI